MVDKLVSYNLLDKEQFKIETGSQDEIYRWVSQGVVDYAFISASDFALIKTGWLIIPNICIVNKSNVKSNLLFFNKNLTKFNRIAVLKRDNTAFLALKILMKELYQLNPEYVKIEGSVKKLLEDFDAVLISGEKAILETEKNESFLDINDEWLHLTGFPIVKGFWIANELSIDKREIRLITDSYNLGVSNIEKICKEEGIQSITSMAEYLKNSIMGSFNNGCLSSLDEMYRYAFFYGFTEYVPELNFVDV